MTALLRRILGLLGLLASRFAKPPRGSVFMFFATPAIGGAERVHARIAQALSDLTPVVFFTERAENTGLLPLFEEHAEVRDWSTRLAGGITRSFYAGYLAGVINKAPEAIVFGGFSYFFYRLLPYLRPDIRAVDLIHNLGVRFETFSLPYAERLDARITVSAETRDELLRLYDEKGLSRELKERITIIENAVDVPGSGPPAKPFAGALEVLYVGRGAEEKRVHLIARAAKRCKDEGVNATFTFVGDVGSRIPTDCRDACVFSGVITDAAKLAEHYRAAHIFVLTSEREGLPVALMEAMAHGAVPVCTPVGGIPAHVIEGETGRLLKGSTEDEIVQSLVETVRSLTSGRAALKQLSAAAFARAHARFSHRRFAADYRAVVLNEPAPAVEPAPEEAA